MNINEIGRVRPTIVQHRIVNRGACAGVQWADAAALEPGTAIGRTGR